jgi:MFS family permease
VGGYWPFVLASVVSGFGIAPTFVQANAVVAEETPPRARTAAFALLASATGLGIALGAAAAGAAVSGLGADQARLLLVPLAFGAGVTALLADFLHRRSSAAVEAPGEIDPEAEAPIVPSPAPPPFPPIHHGTDRPGDA